MGIYHNIISMKAHIQEITNGQIECLAEEYTGIDQIIPCRCNVCSYEFKSRVKSFYNKSTKNRNHCPNCRHEQSKINDIGWEPRVRYDRTHHIVYKITNLINGKYYVGKHSTDDVNDSYMGSGKGIESAIKKYGIENFKKEILFDFDTEEEALCKEKEIVNAEFVKNPMTYNNAQGGRGYLSGSNYTYKTTAPSPEKSQNYLGKKQKQIRKIERKPSKYRTPEETRLAVIEKYQEGLTLVETGNLFGISKTTVKNILKDNNIELRSASNVKRLPYDEVIQYKLEHPTALQKDIAKMFNIPQGSVSQILRSASIQSQQHKCWTPEELRMIIEYVEDLNKSIPLSEAMLKAQEKYGISPSTLEKQIYKYRKNNNMLGSTAYLSQEKVTEFITAVLNNNGEQVIAIGQQFGISECTSLKYWNKHKAEYGF